MREITDLDFDPPKVDPRDKRIAELELELVLQKRAAGEAYERYQRNMEYQAQSQQQQAYSYYYNQQQQQRYGGL